MSEPAVICSAKGCRQPATIDLRWRNPRLHDAARVKHWVACEEHAGGLADFLDRRGFMLGQGPLDDSPLGDGPLGDGPLGDGPLGDGPLGDG